MSNRTNTVNVAAITPLQVEITNWQDFLENFMTSTLITDGVDIAQVSASGALLVDGSGITQPVSIVGTVPVTGTFASASANLVVVAKSATATTVTATLPAVVGQFHYITSIVLETIASGGNVSAGSPGADHTTTNLNSLTFTNVRGAQSQGSSIVMPFHFPAPVRSAVANTASTIVMTAGGASQIWKVTVFYYTAA